MAKVEVYIREPLAPGGGYWTIHNRFSDPEQARTYGWVARWLKS